MAKVLLLGGEKYSFRGDWQGDPIILAKPPLEAEVVELEGVTAVVTVPTDWLTILSVREPVLEEVSARNHISIRIAETICNVHASIVLLASVSYVVLNSPRLWSKVMNFGARPCLP